MYGNGSIMGNNIVWFLITLFYCKIIEDCLRGHRFLRIGFIVAFLFIIYFRLPFFFVGQAIVSYPFYFAGKHYSRQILAITSDFDKVKFLRMALCLMLMIVLPLLNGKVSIYGIQLGDLHFPINVVTFYICATVGTMFALDLASFFTQPSKVISIIASSLISIVGFQKIFVNLFTDEFGYDNSEVLSSIIAISIMFICVVMHQATMRLFPCVFRKKKLQTR